jgi:hypothetical protein
MTMWYSVAFSVNSHQGTILRNFIFLIIMALAVPALAQYQTDPTHLYPASSNTSPAKKTPPHNKVTSTQDKAKSSKQAHAGDLHHQCDQTSHGLEECEEAGLLQPLSRPEVTS